MSNEKVGIAFRSSVIPPSEILKLAKMVDQSGFTHLFVNESSQSLDCLEICSAVLGVSKGILVGSGVIRLPEHDERVLLRRLQTMQEISGDRFVLGVGTGSVGNDPGKAIDTMLSKLEHLQRDFSIGKFPTSFIATLRAGIARKVAGRSDGILLNFCNPDHARRVLSEYKKASSQVAEFACYLKVFYSKKEAQAKKLFVEEFEKYTKIPVYFKMFKAQGILEDIHHSKDLLSSGSSLPASLMQISLVNPMTEELKGYVANFKKAGITLPCIYPYFAAEDPFEFRVEKVRSILSVVE